MVTASGTMVLVERMARFAAHASYDDLSEAARGQLKIRVLDALACAIGALDGEPVRLVRAQVEEFDTSGPCSLIGGGSAAPDRAAFYNSTLVRYLDFNDSYLAKGETCHPSDNLGAVLAAAEYAGASGRDFLAALALAYQVQCRLSDVAPVRDAGFDHVTQGAYAVAAGCARALGLDATRTAHAIAIAGTAFNALRVTRTGRLSHWKGLAYPNVAGAATWTTLLARRGITGPLEVFEGEKGFMDAVAGYFELNWESEDLERVTRTILKKYNAEIHSQSVLEADGEVMPEQYLPTRIRSDDVQALLQHVTVHPDEGFSRRFPAAMPCRIQLTLRDGRVLTAEVADYPGFITRGRTWEAAREKFQRLSEPYTTPALRDRIATTVSELERFRVAELTDLLARVGLPMASAGTAERTP